jgi:serine phosphatase RsbU (regulator of sigma subunit)
MSTANGAPTVATPRLGGGKGPKPMPVPVPRQRTDAETGHSTAAESSTAVTADAVAGAGDEALCAAETGDPVKSADGDDLVLLVIEDDPAGPFSVPELPEGAGTRVRIRNARNLTEAQRLLTDDIHCILVDLALPGSTTAGGPEGHASDDLEPLRSVLRLAPRHAVLALAAEGDAERAAAAVRAGAQDYLFRDELDGRLLSRAIRYAVERKRADGAQRQLTESRLHASENARLERGLLPTPLLEGSALRFASRYRPGRSRALLGGDFYDTIRTGDGTVHVMIGDVSGHGPDEAALGVELRIAWRALTLAGLGGDATLRTLQQVLEHERESEEMFATLCTVDIDPDERHAWVRLAGHPAPLLARHGERAGLLPYEGSGPALGLLPGADWPRQRVELGESWDLMMYTDGLIEGRAGPGTTQRLGEDAMAAMVNEQLESGLRCDALLEAAVAAVQERNGGELTDDVAVLLLGRGGNGRGLEPDLAVPGLRNGAQRPPL